MAESTVLAEAAGHEIAITSPSKVFFPERRETKLDLVRYYLDKAVEEPLMRAMQGRPVLLQRYPNGVGGPSFFQKRVPEVRPDWLQTAVVSTPNGTTSDALVAADLAHVIWAVNLGCIGFHVWPSHADDQAHADELRIDLDPSPGVTFAMVQEAAWWKEERGQRVFIDYNQNAPHKTIFGAWSVRARPGAQVSTPFQWEELESIQPDTLTIVTVPRRGGEAG